MTRPTRYEDHRGREFTIKYKRVVRDDEDIGGENTDGNITINPKRSLRWQARALFHELLHSSCDGFGCTNDPRDGLEEVVVLNIEENMTRMWELNPHVFTWIHQNIAGGSDG